MGRRVLTAAGKEVRARDLFDQALALHRAGKPLDALPWYDKAVRLNPRYADAYNNRGIAYTQLGRSEDALTSYQRAIAENPLHCDALVNQGNLLGQLGRFAEAIANFDQALAINPEHGLAAQYRAAAVAVQADALLDQNGDADRLLVLGLSSAATGDFTGALAAFDAALTIDSANAAAHGNRGAALQDLGRLQEALDSFDRSIACDPAIGQVHHGRGFALMALDRQADAIVSFDRAITLGYGDACVHYNRAKTLAALGRHAEALAGFRGAASRQPGLAEAHHGCSSMLWQLGDPAGALASADAAIALDAQRGRYFNLRGLALIRLGRREEALASFERAIALDPADANAHNNRGELLEVLGRNDEAIASMEQALALNPGLGFVRGQLLHLRMRQSDWRGHAEQLAALTSALSPHHCEILPFALLTLVDDPVLHRIAAAHHLTRLHPDPAPPLHAHPRGDRIRIGYFSADFFSHATMYLIADMLEAHDRARFEIIGFSYGPDTGDSWRTRAARSCDKFIDVRDQSDRSIAELARSLRIDIAVDLKGITGGSRHGIFAARAAPIQVAWLGYPGTMPATFIDYLVADSVVIPPDEREHYAENIVYLPHTYQANCRVDGEAAAGIDRATAGLPERGFVFCCFNQNHKITPEVFAIWMRILSASEGSVLWLWADQPEARANLRRAAEAHGVSPGRLIFAGLLPREHHLKRLGLADLFLDTRPYGAHTTASDALRVGVPVLTCPGRSFASRVAASLLEAIQVPELICHSLDDYERRAIELSRSPEKLIALRTRIDANRATAPLFDPQSFTRHLEQAYAAIDDRSRRNLPLENVVIAANPS